MSTIKDLIQAASDTSEYVDLMRMPSRNQNITKYAAIKFNGMKPELKDTGFRMISKSQNIKDNAMAVASVLASPFMLMSGFKEVRSNQRVLGGSKFLIGSVLLINGAGRFLSNKKAKTLVFPKGK